MKNNNFSTIVHIAVYFPLFRSLNDSVNQFTSIKDD